MKRTLALSLILAALAMPLKAVDWTSATTGDQTVTENVTVTGTATVGNIIFNGNSTVSGAGSIGGSGNLTVNNGTVVFDGVSRSDSTGNITIAAGATLVLKNGAQVLNDERNTTSRIVLNGTLKVENLQYGTGNLGSIWDNTSDYPASYEDNDSLWGTIQLNNGGRLEVTKGGKASIGVFIDGSGSVGTIAFLSSGTADAANTFTWAASDDGKIVTKSGQGNGLKFEVGEYAQFVLEKEFRGALKLEKVGAGELVIDSTVNLESGRYIWVGEGTLTLGQNANITSAGDGIIINTEGTLNMAGRGGNSGIAVTVKGKVINGQNNEMNITLGETGSFRISEDATSGYNGSLVITEGAEVDLGNYVFYNAIDISAGGEVLNAANYRGSFMLGVDDEEIAHADSAMLAKYSSSLASAGSVEVSLTEDFISEAPEFDLLRGRLYAAKALSIKGTGGKSVSISGYQSEYGALSAQNGDISITGVVDVTLSNNSATSKTLEDHNRAGALSSAGALSIEAGGAVTISDNTVSVNSDSAGALYAVNDLRVTGASISITGNSAGSGDAENPEYYSGGALKSASGSIFLTATKGDVEISGNTADESGGALYASPEVEINADESGGALYASPGVEIKAAGNISISGNTALTADGGAIYSDDNVSFTPGEEGKVTITSNTAGGNGGAIYSNGTVYMSGGSYEVSGNSAGSYGGAIYAESVEISADAGDITFSGNTHDGDTANDVELDGGTAALSASNGYTLEMQGGVTSAGEIAITTEADSVVRLGGTSSTESLRIEDGQVHGIYDADGNQAVINVSTSVTLSNACLQDIALVDEWGEAALTSSASTYVYNDAVGMLFETLDDGAVNCTSSAPLLNAFASVDGDLSIGLTADFLNAALAEAGGEAVNISLTLLEDTTNIGEEGSFTLSLDAALVALLDESTLEEYGFYDADGNCLGYTAELTEAGGVVFSIMGLTDLIPEPTTTTLSLLALCTLCARRRRR